MRQGGGLEVLKAIAAIGEIGISERACIKRRVVAGKFRATLWPFGA